MPARNGKFGVGILIDAQNRVTGPAETAARSMMVLGRDVAASGRVIQASMQVAAGGIAVMAAGLKGLKKLFSIANEAGKFTQEMAAVQTIIGANAKEFKLLEKTALQAGLATQFSPLESAQALRAFAQAGLTGRDAMKALRPALDLASVSLGKLSPERAAQTLNATLKTFGMAADKSKFAMNALVGATNKFNISVHDLPIAIGNVARGAKALNQDMDSTLNVLGLVKNVLPQMGSAATLTSSAMLRIADATVQKKLKKLGVTIQDSKGKFLPLINIFNNLQKTLKHKYTKEVDRAAVVTKLLGKRAIAPFVVVTGQLEKGVRVSQRLTKGMKGITIDPKSRQAIVKGDQAIQFLNLRAKAMRGEVEKIPKAFIGLRKEALRVRKEAGKGGGAGDLFVKRMLGTFRGQVTLLKGAWESFMIAIGKPLIAAFKPFVSMMFHGLGKITKFVIGLNKAFKETLGRFFVGFSVSTMLTGAVVALKAAFVFLKPVIWAAMVPLLKLIAIAALLTLAGEGLRHVWEKNLGGIRTAVMSLWMGIKQGFNEFIGPLMNHLLPFLGEVFKEMIGEIVKMLAAFGLVSKDTTGKMSVGWMEVGKILFKVFAFFLKAIILAVAGVAKLVGWIAYLVSWIGKAFSAIGGFFSRFFGGKKKTLPVVQVQAKAGGKTLTVTQGQANTVAPKSPTPRPVPIGTPGVTPPTGRAGLGSNPFVQNTSTQPTRTVPTRGTVTLDGNRVGTVIFDQQKQNQSRGLIRTTVKEQ